LQQGARFRVMEAQDARLTSGFHAYEYASFYRWTDDDAALPPELFAGFDGPAELLLHVGDTARYIADGRLDRAA
jgi:hypothetical protein